MSDWKFWIAVVIAGALGMLFGFLQLLGHFDPPTWIEAGNAIIVGFLVVTLVMDKFDELKK